MPVAVVSFIRVVYFGFVANVDSLRVVLVHIVDVSQIIVREWMLRVYLRADF